MDEFNQNMPGERVKNVQLLSYPTYEDRNDEELLKEYEELLALRSEVLKALEEARNAKVIGSSQEALVSLPLSNELTKRYSLSDLAYIFVVSEVKLSQSDKIEVIHHPGIKCDRCWNYFDDAIDMGDETHLCPRCLEVLKKNGQI